MKVGYIPVSKQEQNEALQQDALREAGSFSLWEDLAGKMVRKNVMTPATPETPL